jgi:hypothetical protein
VIRMFDLRRRAVPLGLAVSGWPFPGITAVPGHDLLRPLDVMAFALTACIIRSRPTRPIGSRLSPSVPSRSATTSMW